MIRLISHQFDIEMSLFKKQKCVKGLKKKKKKKKTMSHKEERVTIFDDESSLLKFN